MKTLGIIIRGTTPTIKQKFNTVDVSDIVVAYLTFKMNGIIVLEKTLEDATVSTKELSWLLSQQETLSMSEGLVVCQLNWKTTEGTRGATEQVTIKIANNQKAEVI